MNNYANTLNVLDEMNDLLERQTTKAHFKRNTEPH